jgi:hypothetical protein
MPACGTDAIIRSRCDQITDMTVGVVADACGARLREWRLAACRRLTDDALAFVRLNCVNESVSGGGLPQQQQHSLLYPQSSQQFSQSSQQQQSPQQSSQQQHQQSHRALRLLDVTRSYALSAAACRQFIAASRAQGVRFLHHLVKPHLLP